MKYSEFLKQKQKRVIESGFEPEKLNNHLFPFQDFIVRRALRAGKYAIFADTGLGKTIMQLEWAHQVVNYTERSVLILAPLAVTTQTIEEGAKFGIDVFRYTNDAMPGIYITNYEQRRNCR